MSRRTALVAALGVLVLAVAATAWLMSRPADQSPAAGPSPSGAPSSLSPSPTTSAPAATGSSSPTAGATPSTSGRPADDGQPQVTIETPAPGESVRLPVHISGTAVAFEATLRYEILDPRGKVFTNGPAYADKGAPERGHWEVDVELPLGRWVVVAFIESPKDGHRIAEARVPFSAG